jgi:ectoine hydroxylase-related dioxygenase (phytanoyl-CoA dioxygenase family)
MPMTFETSPQPQLSEALITEYRDRGAIRLPGAFETWVEPLQRGVEANLRQPSPYALDVAGAGEPGRFFEDYCNWSRIPEFHAFVWKSPCAAIAAQFMGSRTAQFFHEHVIVKEPGTDKPTPWHQDIPYYCVDGSQTISIWIALDPIPRASCPEFVAGSHRWPKLIRPSHWSDDSDFYQSDLDFTDLPDIDANPDRYEVMRWDLEPGDALLFSFRTLHGAPGNSTTTRRRGFSARWVGDDVSFVQRSGRTSPPFPGIGLETGERLREDWFPVVWPEAAASSANR